MKKLKITIKDGQMKDLWQTSPNSKTISTHFDYEDMGKLLLKQSTHHK